MRWCCWEVVRIFGTFVSTSKMSCAEGIQHSGDLASVQEACRILTLTATGTPVLDKNVRYEKMWRAMLRGCGSKSLKSNMTQKYPKCIFSLLYMHLNTSKHIKKYSCKSWKSFVFMVTSSLSLLLRSSKAKSNAVVPASLQSKSLVVLGH